MDAQSSATEERMKTSEIEIGEEYALGPPGCAFPKRVRVTEKGVYGSIDAPWSRSRRCLSGTKTYLKIEARDDCPLYRYEVPEDLWDGEMETYYAALPQQILCSWEEYLEREERAKVAREASAKRRVAETFKLDALKDRLTELGVGCHGRHRFACEARVAQ